MDAASSGKRARHRLLFQGTCVRPKFADSIAFAFAPQSWWLWTRQRSLHGRWLFPEAWMFRVVVQLSLWHGPKKLLRMVWPPPPLASRAYE